MSKDNSSFAGKMQYKQGRLFLAIHSKGFHASIPRN